MTLLAHLSSVLPVGTESDTSAVVRGIEMGFIPAPLHRIHVQSGLATGHFPVGVRSCFPIEGIEFIMGNDIAGGKVYPVPEVVAIPIPETDHDDLAKKHPDVFAVSVLSRAKAHKLDQDVDLSDTLFASVIADDGLLSTGTPVNCTSKGTEQATETDTAVPLPLTYEALIDAQKNDPSLAKCLGVAAQSPGECEKGQPFFFDKGV